MSSNLKKCSEYVLFLLIFSQCEVYSQDFGYDNENGPSKWLNKFATCVGKRQSPIDIDTKELIPTTYPPLKFHNFDTRLESVTMENNGHTVLLKVNSKPVPTLTGGPLQGVFKFAQLHFHWGPNDTIGSENQINHHSYPLELHLVFFNDKFSFQEAANRKGGLTVLSFLIALGSRDNEKYDQFVRNLREVHPEFSTKAITNFVPLDFLVTEDRNEYYTYEGSLTTPPCSEVVTWIEFLKTVHLSRTQSDAFRTLSTRNGLLTHNYRPVQPRDERPIYYNGSSKIDDNTLNIFIMLTISLIWQYLRQ